MAWFRKSFGQSNDYQKISDLEEAFGKLASRMKAVELEWDTAYDKLRQLAGRITKRAAIIEASQPDEEAAEEPNSDPDLPPLGLSKRQQAINDRILASRRRI